MTRRERLLGALDVGVSTGLEIGPLHAPVVRRDEGRVLYVDYAATEVVRANRNDPAIDPEQIAEVDIVWGERRLAAAVGERVDYVVASHVIEHVPDLIGWLDELAEVLKPGGVLGLAIPDRRFTFDRFRNDTSVADVVEAWLDKRRMPVPRQILDVAYLGVDADPSRIWNGVDQPPAREQFEARLRDAFRLAAKVHERPRYVDIHCWVFTPASFLDLARSLALLERFPFRVDAFFPTERGGMEFHVRLAACADQKVVLDSLRAAEAELAAAPRPEGAHPAEAEVIALRAEAEAYRRSTSWRLTAPLRALARLVRR